MSGRLVGFVMGVLFFYFFICKNIIWYKNYYVGQRVRRDYCVRQFLGEDFFLQDIMLSYVSCMLFLIMILIKDIMENLLRIYYYFIKGVGMILVVGKINNKYK